MQYLTRYNMFLVIFFFVLCDALNIRTVPEKQNVTKREINPHKLFPDWVPFKNKHGEELGEFVQVDTKRKPKKRLAPPQNFILRAVAEPEGDDYYDKGLGEEEDNYDNKDWSDLNRAANTREIGLVSNHSELSDIEGLVQIITQSKPVSEAVKENTKNRIVSDSDASKVVVIVDTERKNDDDDVSQRKEEAESSTDQNSDDENSTPEKNSGEETISGKRQKDEDSDYEDQSTEKAKHVQTEDERKESEARKAKILDSVDELKARHAQEQRLLSEKLKEEEIYKEEFERNKMNSNDHADKYAHNNKNKPDYDDYNERDLSVEDKYKMKPLKRRTTILSTTSYPRRMTEQIRRRKDKKNSKSKNVDTGKLSVFKNPRAYMILDDDEISESSTITEASTSLEVTPRFSSKFTATPTVDTDENVRISLVPEDNSGKEGEPTLFFPKKRKNKRRRKFRATTVSPDSSVAESIADGTSENYVTGPQFTNNGSDTGDITAPDYTAPSASSNISAPRIGSMSESITSARPTATQLTSSAIEDSTASAAASAPSAVDTEAASSDHKKEPKHENYEHEHGGEKEHHSEHEESHEEHGKKAYEGVHKDTKTSKGHHDKEDHLGEYHDHGGFDKHHHDEKKHYGAHEHEEHGKKHAKYEESGKHSKGHSTKGSHDIHKKEEYEKKVEFFEEEGDSAEEEKHGGHTQEREHKTGGHFKKGNLVADYHGRAKGDKGYFAEAGHADSHKGHKASGGHDGHGKHGGSHFNHGGSQSGKKWIYHHGNPAKNANLVLIDRRNDGYQHGPQYFG